VTRRTDNAQGSGRFSEALPDQAMPVAKVTDLTDEGTPVHYLSVRRFYSSEDKEAIADAILNELQDRSWYRIDYHLCLNEEQQPCPQNEQIRSFGSVPVGV
jgi:hypothetical protein